MKKRVIATAAIGHHRELFDIVRSKLEMYAELHGYEISNCQDTLDPMRPHAWTKIIHIINLMKDYEEILWIDADAIILDGAVDVSSIVEEDTDLAWVWHSYENQSHPNSGVMYIKVNKATCMLFLLANEQRDLSDHPWWDQAALMRLLGIESDIWPIGSIKNTELIPVKEQKLPIEWNSIRQDPAKNPKIRHLAGEDFWVRKLLLTEHANSADALTKTINEVTNQLKENLNLIETLQQQNKTLQQQNKTLQQQIWEIINSKTWRLFSFWRFLRGKKRKKLSRSN